MAVAEILREQESSGGWHFDAQIANDDGSLQPCVVVLSWPDYNHLSPDGGREPQEVALEMLHVGLQILGAAAIGESVDVATILRAQARRG